MNCSAQEAHELVEGIEQFLIYEELGVHREVVLAPPYIYLSHVVDQMHLMPQVKVAAQNCHQEVSGAFTGEVSAAQLRSVGVDYVIIGHSERRLYFQEDGSLLRAKVDRALAEGLSPVFCCGEPESIRDRNGHKEFVEAQLNESLFHLGEGDLARCIIAYEPVWAIGTGKTATSAQAQEMHAYIRFLIEHQYGRAAAATTTILYGGSCKPDNAVELFSQPDVDGGLIGGASLDVGSFTSIIKALKSVDTV